MTIHRFDTTGDAYDACNYDDTINTGDILLIVSEGVIGLADAWPVAITVEAGNLHQATEGNLMPYLNDNDMAHNLKEARQLAVELGFEPHAETDY